MPHKFNAARRHKFDKAQYRVIHATTLSRGGRLDEIVDAEAETLK